ncbi:MAG: thiol:disulfide interchange protein DsbA/DsbL [Burkholderiales bacterium]
MKYNRRTLIAALTAGAALPLAPLARAQRREPDAGIDYRVLDPVQPTESGSRIEVMEFFWYGCPHCYAFEPPLSAWVRKLPADVAYRRLPAQFNPTWAQHAKLFYALEALGQVERLHKKCFDTIHMDRRALVQDADMTEWAVSNGIDRARFTEALNSAEVATKMSLARQTLINYRIDGVPAMALNGRFLTSPSIVGSHEGCLQVLDFLIVEERKRKRA